MYSFDPYEPYASYFNGVAGAVFKPWFISTKFNSKYPKEKHVTLPHGVQHHWGTDSQKYRSR